MGNKINFNPNAKKTNRSLKIAMIIIIALIIVYIVVKSIINVYVSINQVPQESNNGLKYNVNEYDSLSQLLNAHGCTLINRVENSDKIQIYLNFKYDLYTGEKSNENFFFNLSKIIVEYENFKNIELIDQSKDIDIEVTCENKNIVEYKINGDLNYYLNHDSEMSSKKSLSKVTNFMIQSKELQQLINGNWDESKVDWGTRESVCNGYNIYFDEGIKYKKVSRKVYNVIFNENYKGNIAGGLNVSSTLEEIKYALGEPTFSDNNNDLYGYISENNYLFFDTVNKEISVYPVVKISEDEEKQLKEFIKEMNESSDIKTFANHVTDLWIDYDTYNFDSNYVDLKYTLRGIELNISSGSLKNGIFIYQNYNGNRNIRELENVYIKDTDIVFEEEKTRNINDQLSRIEQGDYTEEQLELMSENFAIRFKNTNTVNYKPEYSGAMFFSRDKKYADSELDRNVLISSYYWYDDNKLVYSVNNDGIYVYNCITRVSAKIVEIAEDIEINSASNGKIIYNETEELNVDIQ